MGGVEVSGEPDRSSESATWSHRPVLRRPAFPKTSWGHRGYDEATVDAFARDAVIKLSAADREVEELRAEIDRLHRYIRRQWATIAAGEREGPAADAEGASPAAQARAVLAHANEIAQRHVAAAARRSAEAERQAEGRLAAADAEAARRVAAADATGAGHIGRAEEVASQRLASADAMAEEVLAEAGRRAAHRLRRASDAARRVMTEARAQYEDLVIRAHGRADQAATVAVHEYERQAGESDDPAAAAALLEVRAAYLQTFAQVSRDALESVLASSGREFDDLLAQAGEEEATDPPLPATPVPGLAMEAGRPGGGRRPSSAGRRSPVIALYPDMHPGRRAANGQGARTSPALEAGGGQAPETSGAAGDDTGPIPEQDDVPAVAAQR
jgi:hypothetical protein